MSESNPDKISPSEIAFILASLAISQSRTAYALKNYLESRPLIDDETGKAIDLIQRSIVSSDSVLSLLQKRFGADND